MRFAVLVAVLFCASSARGGVKSVGLSAELLDASAPVLGTAQAPAPLSPPLTAVETLTVMDAAVPLPAAEAASAVPSAAETAAPALDASPSAANAPTALATLRETGGLLKREGADAARVTDALFLGEDVRRSASEEYVPKTRTLSQMGISDLRVERHWRALHDDAAIVEAPEPAGAILAEDVAFFRAGVKPGSEPYVRAAENGYLQVWSFEPGVIRAYAKDDEYRDYPLRQTGIETIHEAYLPPDIDRFTVFEDHSGGGILSGFIPIEKLRIERVRAVPERLRGAPWLSWIDRNLNGSTAPKRATLYGFLSSLFRLDWPEVFAGDAALDGLPRGVRPDDAAITDIVRRLAERWDALGLDRLNGSFDYWLVMAATAHLQSPASLWRASRLIASLKRPRASLSLVKMLALHLRGRPGHPIELFGDPGEPRTGFVDAAVLVELLPAVVEDFLDRLQDQRPDTAPGGVSERALSLWVIASALDPRLYLADVGRRMFAQPYRYHEELLERLAALRSPERMQRLLGEIEARQDWDPLKPPWLAASDSHATYGYQGTSPIYQRMRDPRPIQPLRFAAADGSSLGDPLLLGARPDAEPERGVYFDWSVGKKRPKSERKGAYLEALKRYRLFFER